MYVEALGESMEVEDLGGEEQDPPLQQLFGQELQLHDQARVFLVAQFDVGQTQHLAQLLLHAHQLELAGHQHVAVLTHPHALTQHGI